MCEAHLEPTSSLFSFGGISLVVWGGGVPKLLPPTDSTHVRVKQHDALWANRAPRSEKGPHKKTNKKMAGVLCYFMGKLSHAVVNRTAESAKTKMASVLCCFFKVNQPGRGP